jgi:hypothetical protein
MYCRIGASQDICRIPRRPKTEPLRIRQAIVNSDKDGLDIYSANKQLPLQAHNMQCHIPTVGANASSTRSM